MAKDIFQGAVADFIRKEFGGDALVNIIDETIGTTPTQVLAADPEMVALVLINLSVNTIMIHIDNDVSTTKGFRLGASGGNLVFKLKDDFALLMQQIWAVSSAANSELYGLKVRRFNTVDSEGDTDGS